MDMKIQILKEGAKIPTRGSKGAAGYDLYALTNEDITILPHETVKINTGIAIEVPEGYFGAIFPRSGIATKRGLRPANCVGVIDEDYRGEVLVALHNDSEVPAVISSGERIAQLIIIKYNKIDFIPVNTLHETERNASGFGDSGRF